MANNHSNKQLLLFLVLLLGILQSQGCHPTDEEALLEFKKGITDDPGELLRTWHPYQVLRPYQDCCGWEGIACDPHSGRVINLTRPGLFTYNDMPFDTSMSGTMSPFLGNLSSLQVLDLGNLKTLTGHIPPELTKLTNLRYMSLSVNSLEGSIPEFLSKLSSLTYLDLSENQLSGAIPQSMFKNVPKLKKLTLNNNSLTGSIPPSLGNLKYLELFDVSSNRLSGEIPPHKIAIPASSFANNPGLCGSPLPACKND